MTDTREALSQAGSQWWPEFRWADAELRRGAFHLVLTAPDGPTLRAALGRDGRDRSRREADSLAALEGVLPEVATPRVLAGPRRVESADVWATTLSTVPGSPADDLTSCSSERLAQYAELLRALRRSMPGSRGSLAPVRAWCGGDRWPGIVNRELAPQLGTSAADVAEVQGQRVLDVERTVAPTLCHGDFGPHNILWEGDAVASVIGWDHACIGDPAIDLAPLISFHGASALRTLAPEEETRRAMIHRSTLPLQVAAAAHLAGLEQLRDHALANFERRVVKGTLFDPEGGRTDWPGAPTAGGRRLRPTIGPSGRAEGRG